MDDYVLDARVEHIRNFVHILSAVRLSKKQHVRVSVSERGLTFVSLDDSKSLQAQANFRAEAFRDYRVNPSAATGTQQPPAGGGAAGSFGLALGPLIDVLNVFAPLDGDAELDPMARPRRALGPRRARRARRPGQTPQRMHTRRRRP